MINSELKSKLQHKVDNKTKPPGSLGVIEDIAIQLGLIQNTDTPQVDKPQAFVFGADHGVCAEGVNPFPQVVTEQMLANFAAGGAAMNVFCNTNEIPLSIINMGIINESVRWPNVEHKAIAAGTRNFRLEAAMTAEQCQQAIDVGQQLAIDAVNNGSNLLIIGEMGIGNTTSASALLSAIYDVNAWEAVGPGTGASAEQIKLKAQTIEQAMERCEHKSALEILAEVGGFEIAGMVGVLLLARELKVPVLVDGFISTAAAIVAEKHQPGSRDYWLFSHASAEPAHQQMLEALGTKAILNLNLRLGEGTGAALAYPIVKCAAAMLRYMASFDSAGISAE